MQNQLRSHRTIAIYAEQAHITQNRNRSGRTLSYNTELDQVTQNHHRSHKTNSDHAEPAQIKQNHYRSRKTSSDHIEPSQITQNHPRLCRIHSDHTESTQITQKLLSLEEYLVMEVFEVAEFESVIKIEVAQILVALEPNFARILGITREQQVVWARRRLHSVSRRILRKDRALSRKV